MGAGRGRRRARAWTAACRSTSVSTIASSSTARTARRCGPNRAIRCGWWFPAGRAMSTSNGCAASRSAISHWFSREETSKYTDLMAGRKSARLHLGQRSQIGHHLPLSREAGGGAGTLRNPRSGLERTAARSSASTCRSTAASTGSARKLHEPILSKALTRFTVPWRWDGGRRCCNRAPSTRPAMCSRPSRSCARCAESIRSITTIRSRLGRSSRTGSVYDVQLG